MRNRTRSIAFLVLLSICITLQGCDKNRIHEAAKASDRIATLIGSAIDLKRELAAQGAITPAEELVLTQQLLTVNTQARAFNNYARTLIEDTAETRLDLARAFDQVTSAVNSLSNQAIFPIKNPEAKKRLLAVLNSINASVQLINAALKG